MSYFKTEVQLILKHPPNMRPRRVLRQPIAQIQNPDRKTHKPCFYVIAFRHLPSWYESFHYPLSADN